MYAAGGFHSPMMMSPMGMMMGSPFGYGLFGTPYCFGGGGFWTFYLLTRFRCSAVNGEGFRCNANSGMFSSFCSFHRSGDWKKAQKEKAENKEKKKTKEEEREIEF